MDTGVCTAESLCCPPETIPTLLIGCTPIQNKKLKKENLLGFVSHIFVEKLESTPVFYFRDKLSHRLLRVSLNPSTEQHSLQPATSSHHGCRGVFGPRARLCACAPSTAPYGSTPPSVVNMSQGDMSEGFQ